MSGDNEHRQALERSLTLYRELSRLAEELPPGLSRWGAEEIEEHMEKVRLLQSDIKMADELVDWTFPGEEDTDSACRELHRQREELVRQLLERTREDLPVVERMLAMVRDEISQSKAFRHAAGGYFVGGGKGGMLTRTA